LRARCTLGNTRIAERLVSGAERLLATDERSPLSAAGGASRQ
jgi:hypothetical protein